MTESEKKNKFINDGSESRACPVEAALVGQLRPTDRTRGWPYDFPPGVQHLTHGRAYIKTAVVPTLPSFSKYTLRQKKIFVEVNYVVGRKKIF